MMFVIKGQLHKSYHINSAVLDLHGRPNFLGEEDVLFIHMYLPQKLFVEINFRKIINVY